MRSRGSGGAARARTRTGPATGAPDERILERRDTVLWSVSADGIVLHNLRSHRFLELEGLGYTAWAYLDGARTVEEVVARCRLQHARASARRVREIVRTLVEHGFVEERAS